MKPARLLYLIPLLLAVAIIVFGEALADLWKEDIKSMFQQNKWTLLAFVLLLALLGFLWERQQKQNSETKPPEIDPDRYAEAFGKFKAALLEQYQRRLRTKTAQRLPINLSAKPSRFGTSAERAALYFKDLSIESEDIASEMDKILRATDRLLLIGEPGAGKTTILLFAAINILQDPEAQNLPLILNLGTWRKGNDFKDWYTQNLAQSYNLSKDFAGELLRRKAVTPFFDGFDEINEKGRDDCFQQMAAYFGDDRMRQLIVCSRKKEYAAAKADAPVYAEMEVQPLSQAQIKNALAENAETQAADRALLRAIEQDPQLAEAVETPFYLNTASFLFGKGERSRADFPFHADNAEGRQAELLEIFVAEQVPDEQDRKHLSFLAKMMAKDDFLVFELVKMQPWWAKQKNWLTLWCLLVGSISTITWFVGDYLGYLVEGTNLSVFTIPGLLAGLLLGLDITSIDTVEIQVWDLRKMTSIFIKKEAVFFVTISIVPGLASGWVFGENFHWGINGWIAGFVGGWLICFISILKIYSVKLNFLLNINRPYQRFLASLNNSIWVIYALAISISMGLVSALVFGDSLFDDHLLYWLFDDELTFGGRFSPLLQTVFYVSIYISQFPQHFSLRLLLYLEGKMPLRVVTFMDRMSGQHIFEDNRADKKDKNSKPRLDPDGKPLKMRGATWRFRHKILQDYFARLA